MPRYTRNSAILAKLETTYGVDSAPTGSANAILVSDLSVTPLQVEYIDRDLIRPYFGASEQLVSSTRVEVEFAVEVQHSGAANTPAAWAPLLEACGFAAPVTGAAKVEHVLLSNYAALKSLTIYYYDDGVLHKLLGARGTVSIDMQVGQRPVFRFRFLGLDGGVSAAAAPSLTLTAWRIPQPVTDTNTGAIVLGGTRTDGTISGGTEYVSAGFELDLGIDAQYIDLLGTATSPGQMVDILGRQVTGKVMFDLTPAQEVTLMGNVRNVTTQSLGVVHGTATGSRITVFCPSVQLTAPRKEDRNGRRMIGFDLRVLPVSGNDEIVIVGT